MCKYRIDIFTGPSVYDTLIYREYKYFKCVDDAKVYAFEKAVALCGDYTLLLVQ